MAKLKKLLKRAAEIIPLPLPAISPAVHPLAKPTDLVEEYIRAWAAKDAEAIGRLFVEDADFVNVVGLWWTGRHSIVKAQRFGFRNAFANATITLTKVKQRMLGDAAAVVMAQWQLTGQVDPEGEPVDPRRGVIEATLVKIADGTWLGVSCTNIDIVLSADTNVSRDGRLTATSYIKGPSPQEVAAAELVDD
ncbi:SgcJ/EcaC family oxidoreductase [Micropruina sp.]|uniref:SgcJ/EcaC family oxidoreductase n=1 Tax=Micropruina sp. TaxID=2737536 RepID=UPI0039E4E5F9